MTGIVSRCASSYPASTSFVTSNSSSSSRPARSSGTAASGMT
jgi:hypothetical protein